VIQGDGVKGRLMSGEAEMKGAADRVICDPPFLSEECQTKGTSSVPLLRIGTDC
jgi:hypothetical protein